RARQARAQYVGALLRRLFDWVEGGARRARERRVERYLAGASDLADLEHRMRTLARRGEGFLG
ncbi:MAG: DUF3563 family protein, partial [Burkholderiales bacterium]|nr:DUF3563 family protein [Burkholderiales bacterium]